MSKLTDLFNAIDALHTLTDEDRNELMERGYNLNTLSGDLSCFRADLVREAAIRKMLRSYSRLQCRALHGIAVSLQLDNVSDYRHNCQLALMDLLHFEDYDSPNDAKAILRMVREDGELK